MTSGASRAGVAGVVLAAGAGTRLRPLTELVPKALCPVDGVPLVDLALRRVGALAGAGPDHLAVNAHHLADRIVEHCGGRAHVSVEQPVALGTAGALGALHGWLDGRAVVLTNADLYLPGGLGALLDGWDGERCRLLCRPAGPGEQVDFPGSGTGPGLRYVGACLLPWRLVRGLAAEPSGLYEVLWRDGDLDLLTLAAAGVTGPAIDCGTPRDYLLANLHATGGRSAVGESARVEGTLDRSVVWAGARVWPDEHLVETVRAGTPDHPVSVDASATPPLEALRRWEDSGAYWRVLAREGPWVELALITCTGDEEVARLRSPDTALLAWLGDRTTNLP